ncbi:putative cytochrome p450 [Diplodia seriata]|uniref:Putative cytochrome p450 n=1 Tax=Diplodia seriata TaxID=420778 RepID=A0A0G2DSG6_9PEZI|nr:putative cytochrome p450 [Diplodia seriata]
MSLSLAPHLGEANATAVLVVLAAVSLVYLVYFLDEKPYKGFPVVGLEKHGFFRMAKARAAWIVNGCEILEQGAKQFPGAFQVITASGPKIVLPNRYANEIRNNPHMSFGKIITREFFSSYPGFEPFDTLNQHNIIQDATKNKLTQSLTLFTADISAEVTKILEELLGDDEQKWTTLPLRSLTARTIAQVTSRVFLGPELSQNAEWLTLCTTYAVTAFAAQQALLSWSPLLRPFVHRFLPALVMDRYVEKEVVLSDGLTLPAGSALMVHATNNLDEAIWPRAKEFDGYRFVKLREQPGEENRHQLVTTSAEHLGFGLGLHACPGRFFAANTMKLMLAQFVMKYDWKFVDEKPQLRAAFGSSVYVNPTLQVAAKRRKEEVKL